MNAGEFGNQIDILEYEESHDGATYEWCAISRIWAKMEHQTVSGVFTKNGVTTRTAKFTIHDMPGLTLHHAVALAPPEAGHFAITDINKDTPGFFILTAAFVEPVLCTMERTRTEKDSNNRPVSIPAKGLRFYGYLLEKYLRQKQEEPMSYAETRYILVTPKAIDISAGELVIIGDNSYEMVIPHLFDPYKNEYEILRRADN